MGINLHDLVGWSPAILTEMHYGPFDQVRDRRGHAVARSGSMIEVRWDNGECQWILAEHLARLEVPELVPDD